MDRYQLLPALAADDYERLKADIAERGVMVAVEFDEGGNVLDGHHRKKIAEELGIEYPKVVRTGLAEYEKRLHAARLNLARRHLTDGQKTILGEKIEDDVAEAAHARQLATLKRGTSAPDPSVKSFTDGKLRRATDEVARTVGLGTGQTYTNHKKTLAKVRELAPELEPKLESGELTMKEAAREVRQAVKSDRVAQIAAAPVAVLAADETFPVILADPPWRYDTTETGSRQIENHYPTMTVADMGDIHVPAADDAVLFCWATSPKLQDCFELLEAWGFTYRTCMVWVKDRIGMGYYARQQHELLLIATRGSLPVPDPADRPSSVFHGRREEHSAKPAIVHELIETMYPHYRWCELFARTQREGWAAWGNQAGDAA